MKLSKDLNLVIELPQDEGPALHVHAMPISLTTYNENALLIGAAMMRVYGNKISFTAASRVLGPTLEAVAKEQHGPEEGPLVVGRLLNEVHRRTMVLVPGDGGWDVVPFDEAARGDLLDETDVAEVDGALLFFSAAWRFHGKADRRAVVTGSAVLWSGSVTSSSSTEFAASLGTSTAPATSGETAQYQTGPNAGLATETGPDGVRRTLQLPS